ncbi:MAG: class I SAM-dependent methyltransferase [Planctomycetia bacterium]|nr:class I SAM-dependent methyltransferase [Planctomycetia bacterium]
MFRFRKLRRFIRKCAGIQEKTSLPAVQYNVVPSGVDYVFRPESDFFNLQVKLVFQAAGGPFETPGMVTENTAISRKFLLDSSYHRVINIGSGVGTFENVAARENPEISFVASDYDRDSVEWCRKNRPMKNVEYCTDSITQLLERFPPFDLAVSIDVIEHMENYKRFLDDFVKLAPNAIIATPNRDRYDHIEHMITPPYPYHVQEFDAGEMFFILRMYYRHVRLYGMPSYDEERIEKMGICTRWPVIIAFCSNEDLEKNNSDTNSINP